MNQTSKKQGINLRPGTVIAGKWHKNRYLIKKRLGHGAVGTVYLCDYNGKEAALKISDKGSSVTMEVNVLKTFQKVQGNRLGPSLIDVDDWSDTSGTRYSFYVMEYLRGKQLATFLQKYGEEWLGIFMLQLLDDLENLHRSGWVFGDLKNDNLLVTYPPPRVRWIDVGGTTQLGRSIKEYTEFYDRGYWGMGTRKAEPSYDLFALVMVILHVYHPQRFEKGSSPEKTLLIKLQRTQQLKKFEPSFKKALYGRYTSSLQMRKDLSSIIMKEPGKTPTIKRADRKYVAKKNNQGLPFLEGLGIFIVVLLFYILYLFLF